MTDTTNTAPEQNVDEQLEAPGRRWFRLPLVLRSALDEALDKVDELNDEAMHWFDGYTQEGKRADQAEARADQAEERLDAAGDRVADLEQQVEELSRRLAEAGTEAAHMNRSFRAVCEERDEERTARIHLQQAGRNITAAFTAEDRAAEPMLDAIGRILIRNAHRFDLGRGDLADIPWAPEPEAPADELEDDERDELLAAAYRYPHDSIPGVVADHLPLCEACVAALPSLADEVLVEMGRVQQEIGKSDGLLLVLLELERRGLTGTRSKTSTEENAR